MFKFQMPETLFRESSFLPFPFSQYSAMAYQQLID